MAQLRVPDTPRSLVPEPRTGLDRMRGLAESLVENPVAQAILDAIPGYALILTQDRQVLAGHGAVLEALGLTTPERLRLLAPGEWFHCGSGQDGLARPRQFRVASGPLRVGRQDLLLFVFLDITDQKRRETLDQVFLHDLLNLVGGLDGIARRLGDPGGDSREAAGLVQELARQMMDEIQNHRLLLSQEDGDLGRVRREARADAILSRLGRFFSVCGAAEGRRLEILPASPEPFICNPVLLTRVLVNLVKNALEATPEGGTVKVWHERRDGRRGFLVENPGVIPAEVAGRIFQRCFSTKGGAGQGLGAYGAKFLGERFLGGEVGFAAQDGGRTRFFIWMPEQGAGPATDPCRRAPDGFASHRNVAPEADPAAEAAPEGADTLLVVDDSRTLCHLLGGLLCPRYRVLTAETGEEGLALALQWCPDLILLDVMMPGLDGFHVCRRLKEDSRTREIPVLFLTALGGEAEEMRALEAGGIDFILKPVSAPVLAARVRNQLELKHQQDRLRNLSLLDGLTGIANRRRFDQYPGDGVAALQPQRPAPVPGHGRRGPLQGLQRRLRARAGGRVPAVGGQGVRPGPAPAGRPGGQVRGRGIHLPAPRDGPGRGQDRRRADHGADGRTGPAPRLFAHLPAGLGKRGPGHGPPAFPGPALSRPGGGGGPLDVRSQGPGPEPGGGLRLLVGTGLGV